MNHRKDKDRRLSDRFQKDHVRSARDKRLKPLNRSIKRPSQPSSSKRRELRELERRLKHKHQENKNPNPLINNSHRSFPKTPRINPSSSSRNSRSHRHSFKHKHYSSSDRHSPWPPGEFDRARGKRNKINFDDIRRREFDRNNFDSSSRRRKAVSGNQRSLKVVRFAPDVQVFEYPNGTPMPSQQNGGPPGPAPNPPTLKKKGYSTTPPMHVLRQLTSAELAQVEDFTIHHIAYGNVKWPGKTDLRGLDLDGIVRFEGGAVYVYENENLPPQGTGLNKPAEISLVGCWPRKMDARHLAKYEQSLQQHCIKEGMSFIDYSPDIGRWRFRVTHF